MRKPLILILALVLSLGIFSYFAEVKYVSQDETFSIGRIGVQFIREGELFKGLPPYRNQIASVASTLAWFKENPSPSSANLVNTSATDYALSFPNQRKCFYANGRFWIFYCDGSNMVYSSSKDGVIWTEPIAVRPCSYGYHFSIYFDGTYVHYAYSDESSSAIYYRRGVPNANGTITWSEEQVVDPGGGDWARKPSIAVDSDGYVWIAYLRTDPGVTSGTPYVTRSGNNDGTWGTTPSGFPCQLKPLGSSRWKLAVVPLTNGKVMVFYATDRTNIFAKVWDGSSWSAEVRTSSDVARGYEFSAVAQGDDVHIVFRKYSSYDIVYTKYVYASGFSSEFVVQPHVSSTLTDTVAPVISMDPDTNDLYVFWSSSNYIHYRKYDASSASWEDTVDWIYDEGITDNDELTCSYLAYGEKVCLAYLSGSNVKFAYIPVAPQISYFQVGVSDISVSGKYVKASPSSPLNTANITIRVYHNVDNNSTWVLAGQYQLASIADLPWSGNTTSPWYELLSGSYAQGDHTYYIKIEILVEGYDAITEQPISHSAYAVLSTDLYWQSVAPVFDNLRITSTNLEERVYLPMFASLAILTIVGAAIYLIEKGED